VTAGSAAGSVSVGALGGAQDATSMAASAMPPPRARKVNRLCSTKTPPTVVVPRGTLVPRDSLIVLPQGCSDRQARSRGRQAWRMARGVWRSTSVAALRAPGVQRFALDAAARLPERARVLGRSRKQGPRPFITRATLQPARALDGRPTYLPSRPLRYSSRTSSARRVSLRLVRAISGCASRHACWARGLMSSFKTRCVLAST